MLLINKITLHQLTIYRKEVIKCLKNNINNDYINNIIVFLDIVDENLPKHNKVRYITKPKYNDLEIIEYCKKISNIENIIFSKSLHNFGPELRVFNVGDYIESQNFIFFKRNYDIKSKLTYVEDKKTVSKRKPLKVNKPVILESKENSITNKLDVVIVSVNYNDYLKISLENNTKIFDNITVVTSEDDIECQEICKTYGVNCVICDNILKDGSINKSIGLNKGIESIKNPDWILILDADIVVNNKIDIKNLEYNNLYTNSRWIIEDINLYNEYKSGNKQLSDFRFERDKGIGFFQLFNFKFKKRYPDSDWGRYSESTWSDITFKRGFNKISSLDLEVIHIGKPYQKWNKIDINQLKSDSELVDNNSVLENKYFFNEEYLDKKVALCAIAKNENNYIREWIEHYKKMNFDKIFIYDNNDIDGEVFNDVIEDYIGNFVNIIDVRGEVSKQTESYTDFYRNNYNDYDWIAYFDIDEFLEIDLKYNNDIKLFLSEKLFKNFNCIKVCWRQYDDSNLVSVIDNNYSINRFKTYRSFSEKYVSDQTKSIFRTTFSNTFTINSPHGSLNNKDVKCCNTEGVIINNDIISNKPTWKGAFLKHYRFKTIEEYILNKSNRGWPTLYGNSVDKMDIDFFFRFNEKTKEKTEYANYLLSKVESKNLLVNSWNIIDGNIGIKNINLGDDLNFRFLPKILPYKIIPYRNRSILISENYKNKVNYSFIGSIIDKVYINENTIIWGSGVKSEYTDLSEMVRPKKICAVRGPLTRKKLIENGFDCPDVYGDPALLLPLFYKPNSKKKFKIGIIKHWRTKFNYEIFKREDIINIKFSGYEKWTDVIDDILSCEYIVSESLHGIIIAEAYNIPNLWVDIELEKLENSIFKFHDFFKSIGDSREIPYKIDKETNIEDLYTELLKYEKKFNIDLNRLIDSCPVKIIL